MRKIDVIIGGEPVPQPRAKTQIRYGGGGKAYAHIYTPDRKVGPKTKGGTVREWRDVITTVLSRHRPPTPWDGPVSLELIFYFSRTQKLLGPSAHPGVLHHAVKPDIDNVEKAVMDAMTDCEIWTDDGRISDKITRKRYVAKGYGPGLRIIAELLDPQEVLL